MSTDAFGRYRVSDPTTLFDSQLQYGLHPLFWETFGTGTAVHEAASSTVNMAVTAGQNVVRQSRAYHRYQPGKSQLILITGVLGAAVAGVTKRLGYYDGENGVFFQLAGDGTQAWVLRSKSTGSVVDTVIPFAQWNMGGYADFDLTKAQIWLIDLEWLGVGRVRVGFVIDGELHYVHGFNHANHVTLPYMATANLPIRYEMVSTTGAASDMRQICAAVMSEGGFAEEFGIPHGHNTGTAAVSVTTRRPVLTIQPSLTAGTASQVNRGAIIPQDFQIYVTGNPAMYEVVYGGTVTGGSAVSMGTNSIVSYNTGGTAISGGEVLYSGYVPTSGVGVSARGTEAGRMLSRLPLTLDANGSVATPLSIVVTGIGGAAGTYATINWRELW